MTCRMPFALLAAVGLLAGCGLKGQLYLPEKSKEVVVRPASGTATEQAEPPGTQAPAEPRAIEPLPPTAESPATPPPGPGRG